MELHESNTSIATGKKRGYSGFLKPEYYSQYAKWVAGVSEKTTGYTLSEFADGVESALVSGDYKNVYKHYYYTDSEGNLQDRPTIDQAPEKTEDEEEQLVVEFYN